MIPFLCPVRGKDNVCPGCKESKHCDDLVRHKKQPHGHASTCRSCKNARRYSPCEVCGVPSAGPRCRPCSKNPYRLQRTNGHKSCRKCGQLRLLSEFGNSSVSADGYTQTCKPCTSERRRTRACTDCGVAVSMYATRCRPCKGRHFSGEGHPAFKNGRIENDGRGYVLVLAPDHPNATRNGRYVFEHRMVMEEHLGRFLEPFENVHHKNGVKNDNRIENLELWCKPQPTGCRAEDALEWAYKIVTLYGGDSGR